MKNSLKRNSGFTILEVVAVLVILGIISALVVSKISISIDTTEQDEQVNVIKAHLRYAQARAMNSNTERDTVSGLVIDSECEWGIKFETDKYWLFKKVKNVEEEETKIPKRLPAEDGDFVNLNDLTINHTVYFDVFGSPVDADGNPAGTKTLAGVITITANTGFIP